MAWKEVTSPLPRSATPVHAVGIRVSATPSTRAFDIAGRTPEAWAAICPMSGLQGICVTIGAWIAPRSLQDLRGHLTVHGKGCTLPPGPIHMDATAFISYLVARHTNMHAFTSRCTRTRMYMCVWPRGSPPRAGAPSRKHICCTCSLLKRPHQLHQPKQGPVASAGLAVGIASPWSGRRAGSFLPSWLEPWRFVRQAMPRHLQANGSDRHGAQGAR